jgi:hypothetical protein
MPSADLSWEEYARWERDAGMDELRQVLYWRWDPLEVSEYFPATGDAYDRYARVLLSRLRQGADEQDVAAHLLEVEWKWLGRRYNDDETLRGVGRLVAAWHRESIHRWAERRERIA